MLLTGLDSVVLFRHPSARLAALLPDARHVVIPGAAHAMHEDNPEAYNIAVLRFIGAHCDTP